MEAGWRGGCRVTTATRRARVCRRGWMGDGGEGLVQRRVEGMGVECCDVEGEMRWGEGGREEVLQAGLRLAVCVPSRV